METTDLAGRRLTDGIAGNGEAAWIPMLRGEDGQAVVEAAIVLPAMVFLLLLALQLTQLQQARILAEYAASAAARAGIVMDGDPARMKQAATLAVLSGSDPFDGVSAIARTLLRLQAEDAVLKPFGLEQVRVYVHNPHAPGATTCPSRPSTPCGCSRTPTGSGHIRDRRAPPGPPLRRRAGAGAGGDLRARADALRARDREPRPHGLPEGATPGSGGRGGLLAGGAGGAGDELHRVHQPRHGRALRIGDGGHQLSHLAPFHLGAPQASARGPRHA